MSSSPSDAAPPGRALDYAAPRLRAPRLPPVSAGPVARWLLYACGFCGLCQIFCIAPGVLAIPLAVLCIPIWLLLIARAHLRRAAGKATEAPRRFRYRERVALLLWTVSLATPVPAYGGAVTARIFSRWMEADLHHLYAEVPAAEIVGRSHVRFVGPSLAIVEVRYDGVRASIPLNVQIVYTEDLHEQRRLSVQTRWPQRMLR